MTNQDAFDAALRLIGEEPGAEDIGDYLARGPYLVCEACRALAAADRLVRSALGYTEQVMPAGSAFMLSGEFPLCGELLPAAAAHIASGLMFDENAVLSERCYGRFTAALAAVLSGLPAAVEGIVQRY